MKIKKITADSMPEAMALVKKELGENAVILYTKNVKKKGFLQLFSNKKAIEVFAAIDQVQSGNKSNEAEAHPRDAVKQPVIQKKSAIDLQIKSAIKPTIEQVYVPNQSSREEWTGPLPTELKGIYERLKEEGLLPGLVDRMIQPVLKAWFMSQHPLTVEEQRKALVQSCNDLLAPIPFKQISPETKIVNLVGPTGVGKTTTAAKIASKAVLDEGKKIAFITSDTYRIAAIEQLKTYAKILTIPVEVVYSREDFMNAINTLDDYDLIIVDTAGRNYQQKKYVDELSELIPFHTDKMETHLVLSATAKYEDMKRISDVFHSLPIDGYIFTKLDETISVGSLMSLIINNKVGASYLTNGQNVPDDVLEADHASFVNQLIEGVWRGRSS